MNKILLIIIAVIFVVATAWIVRKEKTATRTDSTNGNEDTAPANLNPLTIESLRKGTYPGSDITIEEKLSPGSNYQRYLTSYKSEGLKIYALLTIPNGTKPEKGWPAILFNHGYIPPKEYRTTERYIAYTDGFSRAGYVLFRPDYRGNGNSEGTPSGAYGSNDYTVDVLNALASVKKLTSPSDSHNQDTQSKPIVDPGRIGMWGHSMGGYITLRSMVVTHDIKAGVIWGGVVGSYPDLLNNWRRRTNTPFPLPTGTRRWRDVLVEQYGTPEANPAFWKSISANGYLQDISGPLELHHSVTDEEVPVAFSETLKKQMDEAGKSAALFTYPGDDHNISHNFNSAMERSVRFFNTYLSL